MVTVICKEKVSRELQKNGYRNIYILPNMEILPINIYYDILFIITKMNSYLSSRNQSRSRDIIQYGPLQRRSMTVF